MWSPFRTTTKWMLEAVHQPAEKLTGLMTPPIGDEDPYRNTGYKRQCRKVPTVCQGKGAPLRR